MSTSVYRWLIPTGLAFLTLGLIAYSVHRDDQLNLGVAQ